MTGVPRGFQRCLASLRFLLGECEVSYFAVLREEFASEQTLHLLKNELPGVRLIVVPQADSDIALARPRGGLAATVVQMWHEIGYAARAIGALDGFDLVFRTRFDVFFHHQFLPEVGARDGAVWLPEQLSWSGSNDMLCLAPPRAFAAYAATYDKLDRIAQDGIVAPEGTLQRALALAGLLEEKLDVLFILYREVLFHALSDAQLQILAHIHPALSVYKLGTPGDSEEKRRERTALAESLTRADAAMPVFEAAHVGQCFGAPECDERDGTSFRWMAMHAQARHALSETTHAVRFVLHHYVEGWAIEHLRVAIDGNVVALQAAGEDAFGRTLVHGTIERLRSFRRPWSRISFCSAVSAVPSETGANPDDHRTLSVAIGKLEFIDRESGLCQGGGGHA